jgi:endonuclease/exonuclease/phosphatase family metal-dependent hydrolase
MATLFRRTRLQPPAHAVPTFPSWRPLRAIDHILLGDGLVLACERARALPAAFSDHLALSLELDVPMHAIRG